VNRIAAGGETRVATMRSYAEPAGPINELASVCLQLWEGPPPQIKRIHAAMSESTLNDLARTTRSGVKPGLFQGRRWDRDSADRKVPLAITLPATVAVSLALWAGLFFAIRALL
jgi:hypothetical protein